MAHVLAETISAGEAEGSGISMRARLVFTEKLDENKHIQAKRAADLFVDTLDYNAHVGCVQSFKFFFISLNSLLLGDWMLCGRVFPFLACKLSGCLNLKQSITDKP